MTLVRNIFLINETWGGFRQLCTQHMSPNVIFSSTPTCQKLKEISRIAQIEHRRGEQPGSRAVENHLEPGDRQERRRGLSLFHSIRLLVMSHITLTIFSPTPSLSSFHFWPSLFEMIVVLPWLGRSSEKHWERSKEGGGGEEICSKEQHRYKEGAHYGRGGEGDQ